MASSFATGLFSVFVAITPHQAKCFFPLQSQRRKHDLFLEVSHQPNNPLNSFRTTKELFVPYLCNDTAIIASWHKMFRQSGGKSSRYLCFSFVSTNQRTMTHTREGEELPLFSFQTSRGYVWSVRKRDGIVNILCAFSPLSSLSMCVFIHPFISGG
jgi:hypothetical protein